MKQYRIEGSAAIDQVVIEQHIAAGERVIVQYAKPDYDATQLGLLNQLAKAHGRNLEIRFYGHYFAVFDAAVLQLIPDAQCVSIDSLTNAINLGTLSELHALAELNLGVFELTDAGILGCCNHPSLKVLALGQTRKCNIDFGPLSGCLNLEKVHTTGHTRNIATICHLPLLRGLSLSSIKKNHDIGFVSDIPTLTTLRLMLGGRSSIAQLDLPHLQSLELIRVQGLEDIGDLGRFASLGQLLIEDQIKLTSIRLGPNPALGDMKLVNCKALTTIAGMADLVRLSQLQIIRTGLDYDHLIAAPLPGNLTHFTFCTGKSGRDAEIAKDLEKRGFHRYSWQ